MCHKARTPAENTCTDKSLFNGRRRRYNIALFIASFHKEFCVRHVVIVNTSDRHLRENITGGVKKKCTPFAAIGSNDRI